MCGAITTKCFVVDVALQANLNVWSCVVYTEARKPSDSNLSVEVGWFLPETPLPTDPSPTVVGGWVDVVQDISTVVTPIENLTF